MQDTGIKVSDVREIRYGWQS